VSFLDRCECHFDNESSGLTIYCTGNSWALKEMSPMDFIPHTVCLTVYSGGPDEFMETPLNNLLKQIEAGTMPVQVGKVFKIDKIVEAHDTMEKVSHLQTRAMVVETFVLAVLCREWQNADTTFPSTPEPRSWEDCSPD